jgi:hypothetical protein
MDGSSLLEGKELIAAKRGTEKGSYHVEQATEAYSSGAVFEPTHRSIPLFDPAMILLNGLITNDKFCLSRTSPSRVRWARRPPQRRAFRAMTDDLHHDPERCYDHPALG